MTLRDRLIGGVVDGLMIAIDTITSFWQTPREVEWAKAAADGLAEREAEEEVWSPPGGNMQTVVLSTEVAEPGYVSNAVFLAAYAAEKPRWADLAERLTSAPTPGAVDGPAEGSADKPSAVVESFPPHPVSREGRAGTHCEEYEEYGCGVTGCPAACYQRAPSAEVEPPASVPSAESPAPEFDWVTAAIPVIAGVLAEHVPSPQCNYILCLNTRRETCGEFDNWADWRAHVAPHIAVDIQSDCLTTSYDFPSGDRPRPLADFPKHQK